MVCVLEQGWNKTLQGCCPPGIEFDTPALHYKSVALFLIWDGGSLGGQLLVQAMPVENLFL